MVSARTRWRRLHHARRKFRRDSWLQFNQLVELVGPMRLSKDQVIRAQADRAIMRAAERLINPPIIIDGTLKGTDGTPA